MSCSDPEDETNPFVDIEMGRLPPTPISSSSRSSSVGGSDDPAEPGAEASASRNIKGMPNTTPLHDAYTYVTHHCIHDPTGRAVWCVVHRLRDIAVMVAVLLGAQCSCWHVATCTVIGSGLGYAAGYLGNLVTP